MKRILALSACALWLSGCAEQTNPPAGGTGSETAAERSGAASKMSQKDIAFLKDAARAGIAELRMGQLAASNGESQAVRELGQRLVKDHTEANTALEKLAIKKGIILPDSMSDEHKAAVQHLSALKGREFDQAFHQHVIADHQKDIEKFKTAASKSIDPEIRSFAEKVLPVLQQHLQSAQAGVSN